MKELAGETVVSTETDASQRRESSRDAAGEGFTGSEKLPADAAARQALVSLPVAVASLEKKRLIRLGADLQRRLTAVALSLQKPLGVRYVVLGTLREGREGNRREVVL